MESLIKTIKKRHEETLDYYQNEILTEGEKKILRSERAFLLMILDDAKALEQINFNKLNGNMKKRDVIGVEPAR